MTLRKQEGTGNWKRKHQNAPCGELALEKAIDLSYDRLRDDDDDDDGDDDDDDGGGGGGGGGVNGVMLYRFLK